MLGALRLDYSERAEGRWESEGTNWGWNHLNLTAEVCREKKPLIRCLYDVAPHFCKKIPKLEHPPDAFVPPVRGP